MINSQDCCYIPVVVTASSPSINEEHLYLKGRWLASPLLPTHLFLPLSCSSGLYRTISTSFIFKTNPSGRLLKSGSHVLITHSWGSYCHIAIMAQGYLRKLVPAPTALCRGLTYGRLCRTLQGSRSRHCYSHQIAGDLLVSIRSGNHPCPAPLAHTVRWGEERKPELPVSSASRMSLEKKYPRSSKNSGCESGWSPNWTRVVDMALTTSSTPIPQDSQE